MKWPGPPPATACPCSSTREGTWRALRAWRRRHPEVPWIVPHLSSFADDWQAQKALIELLVRLPNVFTDTSEVRYFDLLAEAVARAGAHKVLYGSDGPYLHPAPELAKIRALHLPPEEQELVLRGNILRLTRPARDPQGDTMPHPWFPDPAAPTYRAELQQEWSPNFREPKRTEHGHHGAQLGRNQTAQGTGHQEGAHSNSGSTSRRVSRSARLPHRSGRLFRRAGLPEPEPARMSVWLVTSSPLASQH